MKKYLFLLPLFIFISATVFSQIAINDNGASPNSNTMLDISFSGTNYKGILIPRMTTAQRTGTFDNSFGASEEGLTVYDTDLNCFFLYDGSGWQRFAMGLNTDDQNISGSGLSGNTLTIGIENGSNQTVDLSQFMDNTDDQNISGSGLSGTTLTIGIENGTNETVDLSSLVDWKLTGNSGTTAGTNFIGTTDAQDLDFRVNNNIRYRITQKGQLYTYNSSNSVHIGYQAGDAEDMSNRKNVIIGYQAGQDLSNDHDHVYIGYQAGQHCTGSEGNTMVGFQAGQSSGNHSHNTFIGYQAGQTANSGDDNIMVGFWAGTLYTGNRSVIIGRNALRNANTVGLGNNVAIGQEVAVNSSVEESVVIGAWAGTTSAGTGNVIIGRNSGQNSQASGTTIVGDAAGNANTISGYGNTLIGVNAELNNGSYTNAMAIGANTTVTASNYVRVGDASVTRIGGQVGWTTISDGRFKKNISDNVVGLDFIMQLRPVTYNLDIQKYNKFISGDKKEINTDSEEQENITYTGFIAQEVEKAAIKTNYNFSGVKTPANDKDTYGITYSDFVVPLVKAVQEQQKMIKELQKQLQEQKELINTLINK